jgi:drug/metabolite transporter (DMT)-like permease
LPVSPLMASPVFRGILWMLAGGAAFTVMGSLIKYLSLTLPITVIVFFRMALALALLVPWLMRDRFAPVRTSAPRLNVLRAIAGMVSLTCQVYSLARLNLADAIAMSFTTPLWMIITAAIMLRETSGPRRWIATVIGFGGVLIIVRPSINSDPAMLAAIASAFFSSVSLAYVKMLTRTDSALTMTFYFSFIGTIISLAPAVLEWVTPTPLEFLLLVATGGAAVGGLFCAARAYALADATVVAPVDFARLPIAALIGYVVFAEVPDVWTFVGAAIILTSVLYIGHREKAAKG